MRLLIATDAAPPQVNGVVRTYERLAAELEQLGVDVVFLDPREFSTFGMPFYSEIRLALPSRKAVAGRIRAINPDHIHIATEGPIGWAVRSFCLRQLVGFTTSYHTKFPEYAQAFLGLPTSWSYAFARHFHNASCGTMVATHSLADDLAQRGFNRLLPWTRGVDTEHFRPRGVRLLGSDGPVFLYVGRVSREKNIEAFLEADLPGRKVVVGDGPQLDALQRRYGHVTFTGALTGEPLAEHYASADVFVFPSRTDTFGLVLLEAMACGLPVAAYPVTGPKDVVIDGVTGWLSDDLAGAARAALKLDRSAARAHAVSYSWRRATALFLQNIEQAVRHPAARDVPIASTLRKIGRDLAQVRAGLRTELKGKPRVKGSVR